MSLTKALLRALEWRAISVVLEFIVVYSLTRKLVLSLGIASVSNIIKTIAHAIFIKYRGR